jgi:hypothetical protein
MNDIEARAGMLRLAADYEAMARRAEEWSGQTKSASAESEVLKLIRRKDR